MKRDIGIERDFENRVTPLMSALTARARAMCGTEGDDVVSRCLLSALVAWRESRFTDYKADTPSAASTFAKWIRRILENEIATFHRRAVTRRHVEANGLRADGGGETHDPREARWQSFAAELERGKIADIEMRNEARARVRLADLSQEETICLKMRLEGIAGRHIARELCVSQATVTRRVQSAIEKLKAVPDALISAPEGDNYLFMIGSHHVVYHPPVSMGSRLDRAKHRLSEAKFQKLTIN